MADLFQTWRENPGTSEESDHVYSAYNGGDVIDVGAFHGWYAALLSPKAADGNTFVLVEPDPHALPTLYRNVSELARLFPRLRYAILPTACGDGRGMRVSFPQNDRGHPAFNSVGSDAGSWRSMRIDAIVELLHLSPMLAKIDVEGAEYAVLSGAERTLSGFPLTLMLELHPRWQPAGVSVEENLSLLAAAGYKSVNLYKSDMSIRQIWSKQI